MLPLPFIFFTVLPALASAMWPPISPNGNSGIHPTTGNNNFLASHLTEMQTDVAGGHLLWCGAGNRAPSPFALSNVYPNLDSCCRQHDNCGVYMKRGHCWPASKVGAGQPLCNRGMLFPYLGCECERKFADCLANIETRSNTRSLLLYPITATEQALSKTIRHIYFQLFPTVMDRHCLHRDHPVRGCAFNLNGKCSKLSRDRSAAPRWQLVDIKDLDLALAPGHGL